MSKLYRGLGFMVIVFAVCAVFIGVKAQDALHLSANEALVVGAGSFAALCILWDEWVDSAATLIMEVGQWGWLTALVIAGGCGLHYYSQHPGALKADTDKVRTFVERPAAPPPSSDGPAVQAAATDAGQAPPAPAAEAASPPAPESAAAAAPVEVSPPAPRQLRMPVRFNCAKRWYGVDYVICAEPELLDGEAGLEAAYDAARAAADDAAAHTQLARGQRAWSKQFGQDCGLPAIGAPAAITPQATRCVAQALIDRTGYLQGLVAPKAPAPSADATAPTQVNTAPQPSQPAAGAPSPEPTVQQSEPPAATDLPEGLLAVKKGIDDRTIDPNNVFDVMASAYKNFVQITAKTDSVVLKKVVINRGNCPQLHIFDQLPQRLKFGESYTATIACEAVEVKIETDQGSGTFTFDN